jgi:PAS domain S-box-containing protein
MCYNRDSMTTEGKPIPGRTLLWSLKAAIRRTRFSRTSEVRVAAEKYRALLACFPAGIIVTDQNGCIIEVNDKAASLLELSVEQLLGRPLESIGRAIVGLDGKQIAPQDLASVRALREHRPARSASGGVVLDSGETRWLGVNAAPLSLPGYGVAIAFADITELRHVESALRDREAKLKDLLAERERIISELKSALQEVQQLRGLLPICSHCKKIRDEAGEWHQIESYISSRSEMTFSHGLCPECVERFYPEFKNKS